jgi:RNA polymerase sigma-70 factor (ECF subfamily)
MTEQDEDTRLVAALRSGDEQAFRTLIERFQASFVRVAQSYVRDRAVAEEVAQETWVAVLQGLDRFEGRSSLKTWMYRILTNRAITRAKRERRSTPFSALARDDGPAVDPDRFLPAGDPSRPGAWRAPPQPWSDLPQEVLLAAETRAKLLAAIERLPDSQREVITLRDIEGLSADEVRELLELSDVNQRVLLHRARSRVRALLEPYLEQDVA